MAGNRHNHSHNKRARIEQLLDMAMNSESTARTLAIADQILELEPDQPEALILRADNLEDESKRVDVLKHALKSVNNSLNHDPENIRALELVVYQRLSYTLFALGRLDEAFSACEKFLEAPEDMLEDLEEDGGMKMLYYRIMVERREWQKILAEAMKDSEHTPAWAYSRLVAAYMLAPEGMNRKICASMFWDALILSPDIPFYMLGYYPEPDESEPELYSAFAFALMFYDIVSVSEDFSQWFTRGVILFGLLSNRFDGRERDYMLDAIDALGGYDEYEAMSRILLENDDAAIIEALAAHKCLSD